MYEHMLVCWSFTNDNANSIEELMSLNSVHKITLGMPADEIKILHPKSQIRSCNWVCIALSVCLL